MGELLYVSPAHRPLSSMELTEWNAFYLVKEKEREKAEKMRAGGPIQRPRLALLRGDERLDDDRQ